MTTDKLSVELADGPVVSVPVSWYPRLAAGSLRERRQWQLIGPGIGIHWPALDEDISVEALLKGLPSSESDHSFKLWLAARRQANRALQPTRRVRKVAKSKHSSRAARG